MKLYNTLTKNGDLAYIPADSIVSEKADEQTINTGLYFLFGVLLSALFQRYAPQDVMAAVFGGNRAWGVMMAATVGVPLYACGGGTIPLLREWMRQGMGLGSATAFKITGPATKITNPGALKIVLGIERFVLYIQFVMVFALLMGLLVNLV